MGGQLGLDELAVQACDVGDGLVLRAHGLAGAGVGAVAEAELVHLSHHGLGTFGSLRKALGQQVMQLAAKLDAACCKKRYQQQSYLHR